MKPQTQKVVHWSLLVLSIVMIVYIIMLAVPGKVEKEAALADCEKNNIKLKECTAAQTNVKLIFFAAGVFLLFIWLVKSLYGLQDNLLVDKEVATQYYLTWLENERKISFPRGRDGKFQFSEYDSEDTDRWYRIILYWKDRENSYEWYAPIEIGRYYELIDGLKTISLGRGRGKITTNSDEANIFRFKPLKKPIEPPLTIATMQGLFEEMYAKKTGQDTGKSEN